MAYEKASRCRRSYNASFQMLGLRSFRFFFSYPTFAYSSPKHPIRPGRFWLSCLPFGEYKDVTHECPLKSAITNQNAKQIFTRDNFHPMELDLSSYHVSLVSLHHLPLFKNSRSAASPLLRCSLPTVRDTAAGSTSGQQAVTTSTTLPATRCIGVCVICDFCRTLQSHHVVYHCFLPYRLMFLVLIFLATTTCSPFLYSCLPHCFFLYPRAFFLLYLIRGSCNTDVCLSFSPSVSVFSFVLFSTSTPLETGATHSSRMGHLFCSLI